MKHNELMIKKHKNSYSTLNYVEHLINLAAVVTGCISISTFASLVGIPIGITSCAAGFEIWAVTAGGTKRYKTIIKRKRKEHDKIVLLAKSKLNTIKVLISKALIDLYTSHEESVLVN